MGSPGAPRADILGITVWTRMYLGCVSRWWATSERFHWFWFSGHLWCHPAGVTEEDAIYVDEVPRMGLEYAVAFTLGFQLQARWLDEDSL